MSKLYLYDDDKRKVLEVDRDDPRLLYNHQHAPEGKIVFYKYRDHGPMVERQIRMSRIPAKNKWRYLYYGETRNELAQRVNAPIEKAIAAAETRITAERESIDRLRANMLPVQESIL